MEPRWKSLLINPEALVLLKDVVGQLQTGLQLYKTALEIYQTISQYLSAAIDIANIVEAIVDAIRDELVNIIEKIQDTGIYMLPVRPQLGGNEAFASFTDKAFKGIISRENAAGYDPEQQNKPVEQRTPIVQSDPNAPPFYYPSDLVGGVVLITGAPAFDQVAKRIIQVFKTFDIQDVLVPITPTTFRVRVVNKHVALTWPVFYLGSSGAQGVYKTMAIYRRTATGSEELIGEAEASVYFDNNVTVGDSYFYRIAIRHHILWTKGGEPEVYESVPSPEKGIVVTEFKDKNIRLRQQFNVVPDGWYKITLGYIKLFRSLEKLKEYVNMVADVFITNVDGLTEGLQGTIDFLQRILNIVGQIETALRGIIDMLQALLNLYALPIPPGPGGNQKMAATIRTKLFDTEDPETPSYGKDTYVAGLVIMAGSPGFDAEGIANQFGILQALLGFGD